MGELQTLTTGPVSPIVATIFATLGCLLSILLLTRARQRTGWRRVRLVTYAIPAVALPAIVLPALVTVLALRVEGSVLLLAPRPLAYCLAAAVGGPTLALVLLCFGRPGFVRQVLAGILLVGAIGGAGVFLAASLTTARPIGVQPGPIGLALGLACVTGFGLATALAATRTLRRAVVTATLLGLSLAAIYHVAAIGLTLQSSDGPVRAADVVGLSPQRIGLPAIAVIAVVLTFTWYFTLGSATLRDLRRTFEPDADAEEIEPWLVEQVRRRVGHTATTPGPEWPDDWGREVAVHAVAIVGRDVAHAIAHRARAALPAGAGEASQPAEPSAPSRPQGTTNVPDLDVDDFDASAWPGGRNELVTARSAATWSSNSRFGSVVAGEINGSDPFGDADPDAWAERLAAARAALAAATAPPSGPAHQPGSPLPRRNAQPFRRP